MRRLQRIATAVLLALGALTAHAADPVAVVDETTTFENVATIIAVLANDTDADGDTITLVSASPGAAGSTLVNPDNTITYTPSLGFTGVDTFTYTATDDTGGSADATVTVTVLADAVPPTISAALTPELNAHGWSQTAVTVTFDCGDSESGLAECDEPVAVSTAGETVVTGNATDRAGNTAAVNVTVGVDSEEPTVTIEGATAIRRGQSLEITALAADGLSGIDLVRFSVDGTDAPEQTSAPFVHSVLVPEGAASSLSVDVVVVDRAGNQGAASMSVAVLTDGYVTGEVYDASRGVPLADASVDFGGGATTSDANGRFGFASEDAATTVRVGKTGFTSVAREIVVDSVQGTLVLDARLTPEDPALTPVNAGGGTATDTSGAFVLTVPPGALSGSTALRLTGIAPHALRAPLPLGWSPVSSVAIGPGGTPFAVPAALESHVSDVAGLSIDWVRYDDALRSWVVESAGLTGDTSVSATIDSTGDYAFVIADTGATAPPAAVVGEPLAGADPVEVSFGLSATSHVTPQAAPLRADVAAEGEVVLFSPILLPSGTLVAARVEQTFESSSEGELRAQPFTQEIPLYRFPLRPDDELHTRFPVTATQALALVDVHEGLLHVGVDIGPLAVYGSLVGNEGATVVGEGGAELVVPENALTATVAADVSLMEPGSVALGFDGLTLLGGVSVDIAGESLAIAATASLDIGALTSPEHLYTAKHVLIAGQRRLTLIGSAAFNGSRISTGGVDSGGTYVFFQSDAPLALVSGTITDGGSPVAGALVESSTTPFVDVTENDGAYLVAAKLSETTITARSLTSGDLGSDTVTPATPDPLDVDIALTATGPFVTTMRPVDGELGVVMAPAITASFSEAVSAASVTTTSFELRLAGGAAVPGRVVIGDGDRSASYLPDANLTPLTTYELELTAAITDLAGNALLPVTTTFTTLDDTVASFDADQVKVTFPDEDGNVTVTAPAGVFEPASYVTIQNVTTGVVVMGDVNNDGSFSIAIRAAIVDELHIRIRSSDGREMVIEKTEYIAEDGSVAIGTKGGSISVGEFTLDVPEGAMSSASIFRLNEIADSVLDALPVAAGIGGTGASIELEMSTGSLQAPADLLFPVPPEAPEGADFAIVSTTLVDELILYETVDSGSLVDGKITTNSFPFQGVLRGGLHRVLWYPPMPEVTKSPLGVITGIVQETDGSPTNPVTRPLAGVRVNVDKIGGLREGDYVTTTNEDGRFTLLDSDFGSTGGLVNVVAIDALGREVRATAFENPALFGEFTNLARYNKAGDVVMNFPVLAESPVVTEAAIRLLRDDPAAGVNVRFFQKDGAGGSVERANRFVEVNELVTILVELDEPPDSVVVTVDSVAHPASEVAPLHYQATFRPDDATPYVIRVSAANETSGIRTRVTSVGAVAAGDDVLDTETVELSPESEDTRREIANGIVGVAEEFTIRVELTAPPENASLSVNGVALEMTPIDDLTFESRFLPGEPRSYLIELDVVDLASNAITVTKSFLAAEENTSSDVARDGPPSIITDASVPRHGADAVPLNETFTFVFTEPVTGVSALSVTLLDRAANEELPIEITGSGPAGVGPANPSDIVTAITIRPLEGLEFASDYAFLFSGDIVDTGTGDDPLGLQPSPTSIDFRTFDPTTVSDIDLESEEFSMTALGKLLFVANRGPSDSRFGTLEVLDFSDPAKPTKIPERQSEFVGVLIPRVLAASDVELADGETTDILAVLTFETFSGNTGLTLFDIGDARDVTADEAKPFDYAGFVTTVVPGQGFGADLALHQRYAYVASGAAGLQVIDLKRAHELFVAENPDPPSSIPASVQTPLFTRGVGFGQGAIVGSNAFTGGEALSVAVGTSPVGVRGYVGLRDAAGSRFRFASVDLSRPFAPVTLATIELELDGNALGWPNRIALITIEEQTFAVVVGGGAGLGKMAVVEVTDPENPTVRAITELQGSWGGSVAVSEGTVYVGTASGLEGYSLADPTAPKLVGVMGSLVNGVGEAIIVNGMAVAAGEDGGLKVAALDTQASLRVSDFIVVDDAFKSVDDVADFLASVVPRDFEIRTAEIHFIEEDVVVNEVIPILGPDTLHIANAAKGLQLPRPPLPPDPEITPTPPPKPNGARLVVNDGLGDEMEVMLDLYGQNLVRPLLTIDTGRTDHSGVPMQEVKLDVDLTNGTSCVISYDRVTFTLARPAIVTVSVVIDGVETSLFTAPYDPATSPTRSFAVPIATDTKFLSLLPRETSAHRFRVRAQLASDPEVVSIREGHLKIQANTHNVLPVGHTFVKGVDLADGHLVASSTDATIPGRGPGLQVMRTYGSYGSSDDGALGAGWNFNFHSRLQLSECFATIIGGDGSGQRFVEEAGSFIPQRGYHTTLRRNDDGSYDFFTKGRVRYHYVDVSALPGRPNLDFIEDTNGNRLQLIYDAARNIIEAREIFAGDVTGRSFHFEYEDVLGVPRISQVTGPLGLEVDYDYDEWANLITVTRDARVQRYEYSIDNELDRHNLVAYIDPNDNRTEYVYYEDGDLFPGEDGDIEARGKFEWVKEVHEGAGRPEAAVTSFVYDVTDFSTTGFRTTTVTDGRSYDTAYVLNQDGSPVRITEPGNVVTTMEWSVDDIFKTQETDALGRVTHFEYDANANLIKETIEAGGTLGDVVTELDYDPTFNKMTLKRVHNTNPSETVIQETHFEIDPANGNLLSTTDAESNRTEFTYFPNGDLQYVSGPRPGQESSFDYDAYGNPSVATDAEGNTTTTLYDERSRLTASTDTFGRSTTQSYDELDRVIESTREDAIASSDTETIVRTYYPGGQLATERNGLGLVTTFTLDALNRVTATSDTLGYTTARSYDNNSNVATTTDRRGVTTTNTYDELNRLIRSDVSGPFGPPQTIATIAYDDIGNKLSETDLHGSQTTYEYDELYRLVARRLPTDPANHVERFTYDTAGNKLTQTDANGNGGTYEYDLLNRAVRQSDAEGNVSELIYDEAGNQILARDVTRGLTTETDYDFLNRPLEQRAIGASPNGFNYITQFRYDDAAHTVTQTDPRGFETTTVLDAFDRVHRVEQDTGDDILETLNYYDAGGNLSKTRDPEGRETDFIYDALNRMNRVDYPLGLQTTIDYDGEGNKVEEINRRDLATRFDYDNLGRLTRTEIDQPISGGPDLAVSRVIYDDANRIRIERDAKDNPTTFEMDEQGRVVTITDALGEEQTFQYDGVNKIAERDKRGLPTSYDYDRLNRLTIVTNALSQEVTTDYDDSARTVTETDRRDIVKTTQLDALGRLISVTRAGIVLERHDYDGNNNRTLSTDANANQTGFTYDGANRLIARTDAFASRIATTTSFQYDRVGNLLEEKDGRPTGRPFDVKNTYDELNRLTAVEDAEGNVTQFEYDAEGNKTVQIEPKSDAHRTELDYGELNELIEVRMADGGRYVYEYDPNRNRTRQSDAENNVVEFTYDELNRVTVMTQDPGGFAYETIHTYDANGNETKLTDPKLQEIDFTYDELNRLKTKTYGLTDADFELLTRTHAITYHYDDNDNLTQIDELKSSGTDPPAVVSSYKTYDPLDRLESETDVWAKTLTYGYDNQGNRTSLTDPDPDSVRTEYKFDELNRLETLTLEAGTAAAQDVEYEYFENGLKKRVQNPNGTASTYNYDTASRMTRITHTGPFGTVSAYAYTYDDNGNRTQQIEENAGRVETTLYDYDLTNRLKTVTYEAGSATANQVTYTYDRVGNRLTEQAVDLETSTPTKHLTYAYDTINRLDSIDDLLGTDDVAYAYDANGNTLTKTKAGVTTQFKYDLRDQLSEVLQGPSTLGRYGYDSEGLRVLKIGDDGIRRYTYDQLSVVTEANESNITESKYDYGLDQLASLDNTSEGRSFFHLDLLRSTSSLTDSIGGTRQSILYDAWGNERDRVGTSANSFTFTGHEKDSETGLIYAKARYYDPDLGRFLTQDSYLGDASNAPSLHRYFYANQSPLGFVDPTGFASEKTKGQLLDEELERRVQSGQIDYAGAVLGGVFLRTEAVERAQGNAVVAAAVVASGGTFGVVPTATAFGFGAGFDTGHQLLVEDRSLAELDLERSYRVGGVAAPFAGVAGLGLSAGGYITTVSIGALGGATVVVAADGTLNVIEGVQEGDAGQVAFGVVEIGAAAYGGRGLYRQFVGSPSSRTVGEGTRETNSSSGSVADEYAEGSFSITEQGFAGYPEGVPRPRGTFRLIDGDEYAAARAAANKENSAIRAQQNLKGEPVEVHEIQPVKFDGSPTSHSNKVILDRTLHRQQVTPWWNKLLKDLTSGPGGGGG